MAAKVGDYPRNSAGGHVTTISVNPKTSEMDTNQNLNFSTTSIKPESNGYKCSSPDDTAGMTANSTTVLKDDIQLADTILGSSAGSLTTLENKGQKPFSATKSWKSAVHKLYKKDMRLLVKRTFAPSLNIYSREVKNKAAHSEHMWTSIRDYPVKLRLSERGPGSEKPLTVSTLLQRTVQRCPNNTALAVKRDGQWIKWTYREYYDDVCRAAKSFIQLGLQPYYSVGILGFNAPEWFISNIGTIFAGGLSTGIYTTNTPEACEFIAKSAKTNIIVVENTQMLKKILDVRANLPHLKAIIQYSGEVAIKAPDVYSWEEFMKMGDKIPDAMLMARLTEQAPNKCCTLIYTSGTTGDPKGVMLSHDNEVMVSYLPLSHVAAQLLDIYMSISCGAAVHFAQPDALKGTLGVTLKEVRPTAIFGVPRVWEKMMEKMIEVGQNNSSIKKKIAAWAKGIGLRGNYSVMQGQGYPFLWGVANAMVFKKVRQALGFDRCKFFLSGAAPITKETIDYFLSLNIVIQEVYGMSESTGPHSYCRTGAQNRVPSVGFPVPGITTKLGNPDVDGHGEVCMYGRHVFMGYLDQEVKTAESFDHEGYLLTGDIGRIDKDGFIFITGRIKELIITAGGENIAPIPIEDAVKEALPPVSQCMLIGDKRKFLTMLITLKTEVDMENLEPQDMLTKPSQEWCRSVGSSAKTLSEIIRNQDVHVLKAIQNGIDKANAKSVSRAAKIQKWSILPKDFSIPGGELGPTMKLKRPIVSKMYTKTINAFYES